ncbi:single-stranded DNA-binding protein [Vulcanococcus sp.]|uniref:single-stranded DNA-binding protein n=1 Tax=Vulcanococcus sp. TaxID=2856995 RepID=UPI003C04BD9C
MASISLIGRLTRDPELRQVGDSQVARLSIADSDRFRARQGEDPLPQYFDCEVWGGQANLASDLLRKGHRVFVTGQLVPNQYTNKDGQVVKNSTLRTNYFTLVETKAEAGGDRGPSRPPLQQGYGTASESFSDEIPF